MSTHVPSFFDLITVIRRFLSSLLIQIAFSDKRSSPLVSKQSHNSYCLLREKKFASTALRCWRWATPIWSSPYRRYYHVTTGDRRCSSQLNPGSSMGRATRTYNEPLCRSIQLKKTYIQVIVVLICWVYRCISSCKYKNKLSMPYSINLFPWHSRPIAVRKFTVI
jgi:hypothetical protein